MTRMVRPRRVGRPALGGMVPLPTAIAPILSAVGLVLVGVMTINLLNGDLPLGAGGGPGSGPGNEGPNRTAAPSNVVVVPEEAAFLGSIVYAKGGNIWIQSDKDVKQLTDGDGNIMPSWSADGQWIIYIHTHDERGYWPVRGRNGRYDIEVPDLMRVKADGSAEPELLTTGYFEKGKLAWSSWIRQPVLSPDGTTIALVTDAPNPDESNVVLQFFDVATKKLRRAGVREIEVLGHQDPEWRADGKLLLYTQNGRDGSRGAPVVMRYDTREGKARALTAAGYMQPAYSPDGRYFAATRTTTRGTDIAILDASNGQELLRLTKDDASWAPVWSPAGDAIAFLHIVGQTVDLRLVTLEGSGPSWSVGEVVDLTEVSGLDASSGPDWFIPPAELPPPTPAPVTPAPASPSASPS